MTTSDLLPMYAVMIIPSALSSYSKSPSCAVESTTTILPSVIEISISVSTLSIIFVPITSQLIGILPSLAPSETSNTSLKISPSKGVLSAKVIILALFSKSISLILPSASQAHSDSTIVRTVSSKVKSIKDNVLIPSLQAKLI